MKNLVVLKAQGNLLSVPPNYQAGADILAVVQQGSVPVSSFLTPQASAHPASPSNPPSPSSRDSLSDSPLHPILL